ncbi:MAG: hypothetical protein IPI14_12470 [Polaromonas sp.]|nr:hypothetical protein [Polaromonas sp.]
MIRQALRILARLAAGLIVVAVLTVPVVLMARVAGNPFGGDLLRRVQDRTVDDATILRLLSIGFYVLWAWFALPAIRQARLCLKARHPRPSAQASPRSVPVVVDRGPQGWLTRLVRYALTSSTIAAITTTTTLAVFPSSALSSMHGSTQATGRPAATVVVNDARHLMQTEHSERPDPVSEIVARRRDTPYSIAARLFPYRLDGARDEILALNVGRPMPDGGRYQGGSVPEGMTVLTPRGQSASEGAAATSGDTGWLPGETVVVEPGDNVWDLSAERLDRADGETLTPTNAEIADHMHLVIDTNTFPSGNPSLIFPGDTINFPAIGNPPLAPPTPVPPLPPQPEIDLPTPPTTETHPPPPAPPDVPAHTEAPTIVIATGTTVPPRHPADTPPGIEQAAAVTDNDASRTVARHDRRSDRNRRARLRAHHRPRATAASSPRPRHRPTESTPRHDKPKSRPRSSPPRTFPSPVGPARNSPRSLANSHQPLSRALRSPSNSNPELASRSSGTNRATPHRSHGKQPTAPGHGASTTTPTNQHPSPNGPRQSPPWSP